MWLPPLNFHPDFSITVEPSSKVLSQERKRSRSRPNFLLEVEAIVEFMSSQPDLRIHLRGLNVRRGCDAHVDTLKHVINTVLHPNFLQFQLQGLIIYSKTRLEKEHKTLFLKTENELINHSQDFMQQVVIDDLCRPQCSGKLVITKRIRVPKLEFDTWVSWCGEQQKACPNVFNREYTRAISRPRTESELIDEEMAYSNRPTTASKTSVDALQDMILLDDSEEESGCTVCLEELSVGSKMKRMPCSHVFHQDVSLSGYTK